MKEALASEYPAVEDIPEESSFNVGGHGTTRGEETLRMSGPRRGHPDEERGTENPHFLVLLPVPGSLSGTGLSVEVLPELHFPEVECCSPSVLLTHGLCFSTLWAYSRAALPGSCVSLGPW